MTKPRDPEATSGYQQNETNVASGFWGHCLSFAVGAIITICILTLDIITDWLMYCSLATMDIPRLVDGIAEESNGTSTEFVMGMYTFYRNIPLVFMSACCTAAAAYLIYFIWFVYMFRAERNYLKDKYDGVTRKGYCCHKYGGEIFILIHALLEDLFVMGILFAIQVAVSCRFQLELGSVVYELAIGTTLLSLGWKTVQLLWNSGCLGQREEYHQSMAVIVLRCCTLLVLVCAFTLTIWNTILLVGWKYNDYRGPSMHNTIMDKVEVDRWKRQDGIALLYIDTPMPSGDSWQEMISEVNPTIIDLISMDEMLNYDNNSIYITRPCVTDVANLTIFLENDHQIMTRIDCVITFKFIPMLARGLILYDYKYTFVSETDQCVSGQLQFFEPSIPWQPVPMAMEDTTLSNILTSVATTAISMTTSMQSNMPTSNSDAAVSQDYTSNANSSMFHTVFFLSALWSRTEYVCSYNLVPTSLFSDSDMCAA